MKKSLRWEALRQFIKDEVIEPVLNLYDFKIEDVVNIHINPTGKFVVGGPHGGFWINWSEDYR